MAFTVFPIKSRRVYPNNFSAAMAKQTTSKN
jgi:hypothetical protein